MRVPPENPTSLGPVLGEILRFSADTPELAEQGLIRHGAGELLLSHLCNRVGLTRE